VEGLRTDVKEIYQASKGNGLYLLNQHVRQYGHASNCSRCYLKRKHWGKHKCHHFHAVILKSFVVQRFIDWEITWGKFSGQFY